MHSTLTGFSDLPTELILKILECLDYIDLLICQQLSRRFDAILRTARNMIYRAQLEYNGLTDPSGMPLSTTSEQSLEEPNDRLVDLQKHQSAWDKLQLTPIACTGNIPITDVMVFGRNVVGRFHDRRAEFMGLPSQLHKMKTTQWHYGLNRNVDRAAFDEDQNLLVAICGPTRNNNFVTSIEFRRLDNGDPHPLAKIPEVTYLLPREHLVHECFVYMDYFSARFSHWPSRRVCIWNWKTGELCFVLGGEYMTGYSFLSEHHVALAFNGPKPTLVILDLRLAPNFLDFNITDLADIDCLCAFKFPKLRPYEHIVWASVQVDQNPIPISSTRVDSNQLYPTPEDNVVIFSFHWTVNPTSGRIIAVLPLKSLRPYLETLETTKHHVDVEWEEWGPQHSRMFVIPSDALYALADSSRSVFGTRFATVCRTLRIYDFNPRKVERAERNDSKIGTRWILDDRRVTILRDATPFEDSVTTSLSYLYADIPLPSHLEGDWETALNDNGVTIYKKFNDGHLSFLQKWAAFSLSV